MTTRDMVLYAVVVAVFLASIALPSFGIVSRTVLRTQRSRDVLFGLSCAFCGVYGFDVAHRLVSGHAVTAYLYVLGLPVGLFLLPIALVRLGRLSASARG